MRIVIVGSGASGVHFALTAVEQGHDVTMVDAGGVRPTPIHPGVPFAEFKNRLEDPVAHFLGNDFEGVVYPGTRETFYGFPPSKAYVFNAPERFNYSSGEMKPYFTFARGGFAETWTGGAYTYNDGDLTEFPFDFEDLKDAYGKVARRVGIGAERDDLEQFMPVLNENIQPLELDPHSSRLLKSYSRQRSRLNSKHGWYMGRSRVATLSTKLGDREACSQCGRCLWGCPTDSIYTPAATLRECLRHPRFTYQPGLFVSHFRYDDGGRITALVAERLDDSGTTELVADRYVLAAGALISSKIFLDSIYRKTGELRSLPGLMDNRQIHVPFLTLRMVGKPVSTAGYQFHHLAFGLTGQTPEEYVHGQITTLKAAALHPILQNLPLDLRSALDVFRGIRAGLGIANVNLSDRRRDESRVTVRPLPGSSRTELVIDYRSASDEPGRIRVAVGRVKRALRAMGAFVPPGLTRVLPKGTSVHYAGTIPMTRNPAPSTAATDGRSHDFKNLYLADAVTFPFLPAKNHTFTLMANAVRIAEQMR